MASVTPPKKRLSAPPCGFLPPRIRALFVTGQARTGGWLADAFAADIASEVHLEEVVGMSAGVARLRDENYDAVLVSHEERLDALELLDALRGGGEDEQSIVVIGNESEPEMSAVCYEAGADAYVNVESTTTRALIWTVARAMERRRLIAENRRLEQAERHRLQLEQDEAARLLKQQRCLIGDRGSSQEAAKPLQVSSSLSELLVENYRELLRTYVIMGSGTLRSEIARLTELLASDSVTSHQVMQLHLAVLENMIQGLGNRSARHVMNRADMLILEVTINLGEQYQRRLANCLHPPRQKVLPGFELAPPTTYSP